MVARRRFAISSPQSVAAGVHGPGLTRVALYHFIVICSMSAYVLRSKTDTIREYTNNFCLLHLQRHILLVSIRSSHVFFVIELGL